MLEHSLAIFLGFFAIMNPIANTPIFLGLTAEDQRPVQKRVAFRALLIAFFTITVFSLLGNIVFSVFGITLPAFRIAGGILVFMVGFSMLHGIKSKAQHLPNTIDIQSQLSVAVSPLAIPLLAGPGTIATAMSYSVGSLTEAAITIAVFGLLSIITYFAFVYGERLVYFLGDSGMAVITKIMGLILAAIGIQMLIEGIKGTKIFVN